MKFIEYNDENGEQNMLNLKHVLNIRTAGECTDFYMSDGLKIRAYNLNYIAFYTQLTNIIGDVEHFHEGLKKY